MVKVLLVACVVVMGTGRARADQCEAIDGETAKWALKSLAKNARFVDFCEPCGDKAPKPPATITAVTYKGGSIWLNGKLVDLAYVFVQTGAYTFTNVAHQVGCPTSKVSATVTVGKKPATELPF